MQIIDCFYRRFKRGGGRRFVFIIKADQHIHRTPIRKLRRQRDVDARAVSIEIQKLADSGIDEEELVSFYATLEKISNNLSTIAEENEK